MTHPRVEFKRSAASREVRPSGVPRFGVTQIAVATLLVRLGRRRTLRHSKPGANTLRDATLNSVLAQRYPSRSSGSISCVPFSQSSQFSGAQLRI